MNKIISIKTRYYIFLRFREIKTQIKPINCIQHLYKIKIYISDYKFMIRVKDCFLLRKGVIADQTERKEDEKIAYC